MFWRNLRQVFSYFDYRAHVVPQIDDIYNLIHLQSLNHLCLIKGPFLSFVLSGNENYFCCIVSVSFRNSSNKHSCQFAIWIHGKKMNLLIICCFTITILGISVQATPDCPEGQHRCANGECHDCCYDSHCGETCGCTICA